jgi:hypothetical protein
MRSESAAGAQLELETLDFGSKGCQFISRNQKSIHWSYKFPKTIYQEHSSINEYQTNWSSSFDGFSWSDEYTFVELHSFCKSPTRRDAAKVLYGTRLVERSY